jgi:hypothetical protein
MPRPVTGRSLALKSYLRLSVKEYEECWDFLKHLLITTGLLGQNFKKISSRLIEYSLMKTIQNIDHNEVPSVILDCSASYDGMFGLVGLSLIINSDYLKYSRPSLPLSAEPSPPHHLTGNSNDWAKGEIISDPQLSTEEYEECRDFLEHFLTETGLLGRKTAYQVSRVVQHSLMKTLQTKAHNDVPSTIHKYSGSYDGIIWLVKFAVQIKDDYARKVKGWERRRSCQPGHAAPTPSLSRSSADSDSSIRVPDEIPNGLPSGLMRLGSSIPLPENTDQLQIQAHRVLYSWPTLPTQVETPAEM